MYSSKKGGHETGFFSISRNKKLEERNLLLREIILKFCECCIISFEKEISQNYKISWTYQQISDFFE